LYKNEDNDWDCSTKEPCLKVRVLAPDHIAHSTDRE
jgi:hypothetical protein